MWSARAQAEQLTLRVADSKAGYFGVSLDQRNKFKPYQAQVWRGGKKVRLGSFATAEEAALYVAGSLEGQAAAAAAERASVVPPLTSEEARQQAQAEGLVLRVADNTTGYFGVYLDPSKAKPYQAKLTRGGKTVNLGSFATAEEAALRVAGSPEGQVAAAAAERATAAPPLTSEEARQQAQAEGLALRMAENKTGYFGVTHQSGKPKPYVAQVRRGGKTVHLGSFVTAEEAALYVARSPEGREASASPPRRSEEESQGNPPPSRAVLLKEESTVPPMPPGAFVKEEIPSMPIGAFFKEEEVVVPPILLDAVVKQEHAFVADVGGRRKRQR